MDSTRELWSTIDVSIHYGPSANTFEWFQSAVGTMAPGSSRCLTSADTNVRWSGGRLPQGHRFLVDRWRVRVVAPRVLLRDDSWWEWCSWTEVRFEVRWSTVANLPLDELIKIPRTRESHFRPAIEIDADSPFRVALNPQNIVRDWNRLRARILEESPMYAVLDVAQWPPIKLRCFLSGQFGQP